MSMEEISRRYHELLRRIHSPDGQREKIFYFRQILQNLRPQERGEPS